LYLYGFLSSTFWGLGRQVMSGFKWGAAVAILFAQTPDCLLGDAKVEHAALLGLGLGASGASTAASGLVQPLLAALPLQLGPLSFGGARSALKWLALVASPAAWRLAPTVLAAASVWFLALGGSGKLLSKRAPQGSEVLLVCGAATLVSAWTGYSAVHGLASVIGPVPMMAAAPVAASLATAAGDGGSSSSSSGGGGWLAALVAALPVELPWRRLPWQHCSAALVGKALVFACVDFSATVAICSTFETVSVAGKQTMECASLVRESVKEGASCISRLLRLFLCAVVSLSSVHDFFELGRSPGERLGVGREPRALCARRR
jgi:hypothetical protein